MVLKGSGCLMFSPGGEERLHTSLSRNSFRIRARSSESGTVRESIQVCFGGKACSLNWDLNFKRLLFK